MNAQVAVAAAVYSIDKPYSYSIPEEMNIQVGMRVIVPFGRGNRRSEAIVLSLDDENYADLKFIERTMDPEPVISEELIRLAAFLRERYFCTFYDAIKAILPAGLWFDTAESFSRTEKDSQRARLSLDERQLLRIVDDSGGQCLRSELKKAVDDEKRFEDALQALLRKKYLCSNLDFSRKIQDRVERYYELAIPAEQAMEYAQSKRSAAPVQYELLKLLCAVGSAGSKELCYLTGCTSKTLQRLETLGFITCHTKEVFRSSLPNYVESAAEIVLSCEQQRAFDLLLAQSSSEKPGVSLLYGVTGSGKTSVYIRLIREMLNRGKSAIFLVPEISLTPQLISLLMSHFGDTVSVLHSALRVSERYDAWKRIRQGLSRVVVGTRSAVFAPVANLGLIIVDEEQEHSYKSENTPRYHAREVAIFRGMKASALVLLGSATPSVESMHLAKSGVYTLNVLSERYNGKGLPQVEIVDLKDEIRRGNSSDLSIRLQEAIGENLKAGHQSILFLNRRGAGRYTICVDCGYVPQCPNCSVSLTYHQVNNRLMCHYCGHSQPTMDYCDCCGGRMKSVGSGTQKLEQQLHEIFPGTEVIRMDADTVSASNSHEEILKRFEKENVPILIGTQMVTKGLNFENVTLVGILDADMSLYVNHFRAAETTFSMLTQVIGRAGRGAFNGKAIIQTMTPEHTVIQLASQQDYDQFFDLEYTMRRMQNSPPCGDLFTFTFTGSIENNTIRGAYDFKLMLDGIRKWINMRILGPVPGPIAKVNRLYRYRVSVLCVNNKTTRLHFSSLIKKFAQDKKYRGVSVYVDTNSYE